MRKFSILCFVFVFLAVILSSFILGLSDSVDVTVSASSSHNSFSQNIYDHDFTTMWSSYNSGSAKEWIQFEFSQPVDLDSIAISFFYGDQRNYRFSINVSSDGETWTEVFNGQSSGLYSSGLESFSFSEITTSYVRIVGNANSANAFNNYQEVVFPPLESILTMSDVQNDEAKNILFIGNSFTERGFIPYLVRNLAGSAGWITPNVSYRAIGGGTLSSHRVDATSLSYVDRGNWDYVVLQDASNRGLVDPNGLNQDVAWFYDRIKSTSPNATIVLYETWATISNQESLYSNWSQEDIDEYVLTQAIISGAYEDAAYNYTPSHANYTPSTDIIVAPAGDSWAMLISGENPFRLHNYNDHHAMTTGYYLSALALYSTIYDMPVNDVGYWVVSEENATQMRSVVNSVRGYDTALSGLILTLNAPEDNYEVSNSYITFSANVSDDIAISAVSLYGNFSGNWAVNFVDSSGLNNTQYDFTLNLEDGSYLWGYRVNDSEGNVIASPNRILTVDTTAPILSLDSQSSPETISFSYTPNAVDNGVGLDKWAINDSSYFSINENTGEITNVSVLIPGDYVYTIYINDSLGNVNESIWAASITAVDTTAPIFTLVPSYSTINYLQDWEGVDFNAEDETAFNSYSVNDTRFTIDSSGYLDNAISLVAGIYSLSISITDTSDNLASVYYSLEIIKNEGVCNILFDGISPIDYLENFRVWSDCNSEFNLYRNGILINNNSEQSLSPGTWNFTVVREDSANYENIYDEEFFVVNSIPDITSPTYSNNNINNYQVGLNTNFSLTVSDDIFLENNGYYIFSTNNSGIWTNDSAVYFGSTPQTIYSVKNLNNLEGVSVGYVWYLYDNEGNENITDIFSLVTVPLVVEENVGEPLSECMTLSNPNSAYYLSNDVSSSGTCFTISAVNVTLDCNNHQITYSTGGLSGANGIIINQLDATIKNCNIVDGSSTGTNNRYGINFNGADSAIIQNTAVNTTNSHAIRFYNNANNNVLDNVVSSSNSGAGVYLYSSTNNTFLNSRASSQTSYGVYLLSASANVFDYFSANSNSNSGFYASSTSNNNNLSNFIGFSQLSIGILIESGNNILNNASGITLGGGYGDNGLFIGGASNKILNSEGSANGQGVGIYLRSVNSELVNSRGISEMGYGFYLINSNNVTVSNSNFSSGSNVALRAYNVDSCAISDSSFTSGSATSVYLYGGSDNNTFTNNVFTSSGSAPVLVSSDSLNNVFL